MYLIAHKYCGKPTFDVASQMACPSCRTIEWVENIPACETSPGCDECEGAGHWWILNDGHRAYPYWHKDIRDLYLYDNASHYNMLGWNVVPEMPADARDAYPEPKAEPVRRKAVRPTASLDDILNSLDDILDRL